jgi:DNA-binding MarR family transcriptional regulator
VSNKALTWAYAQRTGHGVACKAVLVALADMADEQNSCWPSQALLAERTEQTERSVRNAVKHLETDGFITRKSWFVDGKRSSDRYFLDVQVTAEQRAVKRSTGTRNHRNDVPEENGAAGTDVQPPPEPDSETTGTTFRVTINEPSSEPSMATTDVVAAAPEAPTQQVPSANRRAQLLAEHYVNLVPLSKFPAVMTICRRAITARYTDEEIKDALTRLAREGRPVTVDVLRIELEGLPSQRRREPDARERLEASRQRQRGY